LAFEIWAGHNGDEDFREDITKMAHKMALVKDWELACPELNFVAFIDGSIVERTGNIWSDPGDM
jgi:hypothetical protein